MKTACKILILAVLTVFFSCFLSCGDGGDAKITDVAIKVNNATTTLEEFNDLIKKEASVDPEMDLTDETRDRFVEYLIRKELMIDEAVRMELDRKKNFIKTIERYWESTLIRNLLDIKSAELAKLVLITDDEINAYYDKNKDDFDAPLPQVMDNIRGILRTQKLEVKLEDWTRSLRKSADIFINEALISGN